MFGIFGRNQKTQYDGLQYEQIDLDALDLEAAYIERHMKTVKQETYQRPDIDAGIAYARQHGGARTAFDYVGNELNGAMAALDEHHWKTDMLFSAIARLRYIGEVTGQRLAQPDPYVAEMLPHYAGFRETPWQPIDRATFNPRNSISARIGCVKGRY